MEGIESNFESLSTSLQKVGESFSQAGVAIATTRQVLVRRGWSKKFRCAKCGKYKPGHMKMLGPRRKGGPGIMPWCLGCIVRETATWEYLDR